jgi:CBS domain containing-hemolysin-like protein
MTRDLLAADLHYLKKHPRALRKLLREPYIVPETKQAADLFTAFRKRRISVALAVDEYGGITGLITMEDLLECIFGDIPSPSDTTAEIEITVASDGASLIDGALSITQFNQDFDTNLDSGEFDTVGGLVLHEIGEIPKTGAAVLVNEFTFTVESVEANRLKTLKVRKLPKSNDDNTGGAHVETDEDRGKLD